MKWKVLLLVAALASAGWAVSGCGGKDKGKQPPAAKPTSTMPALKMAADSEVREPAVAGAFYPVAPAQLVRMVDALLAAAAAPVPGKVRALICPHAGYAYSGITAAAAYKQVMGSDVNTAIVLCSSHTARFDGASIPAFKAYRTPLGLVPVSPKAALMAREKPFVSAPAAEVKRPNWWQNASKKPPADGKDTPHTWEHSVEVQLPFLQRTIQGLQLVPVVYGQVDPIQVATALTKYVDDKTILVASSDLSHYHPYEVAKGLDASCIKAIGEMDLAAMSQQEACGRGAILTIMQLAKERGWKPYILDYRNSGDVPKGKKDNVVGYVGVAFVEEGAVKNEPLTTVERTFLLRLARESVNRAVTKSGSLQVNRASLPQKLLEPKGCFVTLNKGEKLRGCIGYTISIKPLYRAVVEAAINAALHDNRFKPVSPEELKDVAIEISVLTQPKPIYYNMPSDLLKALRPGVDGVVLQAGNVQSVYLPMVWKEIPDPEKFMQGLSRKAGLPADAWRQPAAKVLIFQVEDFAEAKGPSTQPATQPAAKG